MQGGSYGNAGGYGAPGQGAPPGQQGYSPQPQPGPQGPLQPGAPKADGHMRGRCQACGRHAPLKQVHFTQNIGALIVRFPKTVKGFLCKRCISQFFWKMTAITAVLGWWGVISFFYTLYSIPTNIVTYLGTLGLPDQ